MTAPRVVEIPKKVCVNAVRRGGTGPPSVVLALIDLAAEEVMARADFFASETQGYILFPNVVHGTARSRISEDAGS